MTLELHHQTVGALVPAQLWGRGLGTKSMGRVLEVYFYQNSLRKSLSLGLLPPRLSQWVGHDTYSSY